MIYSIGLVEQNEIYAHGLEYNLNLTDEFHLEFAANSVEIAFRQLIKLEGICHVLLINASLADGKSIRYLRKMKQRFSSTRLLIYALNKAQRVKSKILADQIGGHVVNGSSIIGIYRSIKEVMSLKETKKPKTKQVELVEDEEELSNSELEVLVLICQEYNTLQIAERLFKSPRTIEGIRRRIGRKIGATSVIGMIKYAYKIGLKWD